MANRDKIVKSQVEALTKVLEEQVDEHIEALDNLGIDDLEVLRKKRAKELKERAKKNDEWRAIGHGEYSEIPEEKEFFNYVKKSLQIVVHFYREATFRCKIVDKHLSLLAPNHLETRFCKIDVEKCPFLVDRLKIRVLPSIMLFKDSEVIGRITGFADLGNKDDFTTEIMEWRLATFDIIDYAGDKREPPEEKILKKKRHPLKIIKEKETNSDDDDDDYNDNENK